MLDDEYELPIAYPVNVENEHQISAIAVTIPDFESTTIEIPFVFDNDVVYQLPIGVATDQREWDKTFYKLLLKNSIKYIIKSAIFICGCLFILYIILNPKN